MKKSLLLSNLRIEVRRKHADYPTEKTMLLWVGKFLNEMSIVHSSQIREWQKELFLSRLQANEEVSYEELLQAKSSLLFLFNRVLKQTNGFSGSDHQSDDEPGILRITG